MITQKLVSLLKADGLIRPITNRLSGNYPLRISQIGKFIQHDRATDTLLAGCEGGVQTTQVNAQQAAIRRTFRVVRFYLAQPAKYALGATPGKPL